MYENKILCVCHIYEHTFTHILMYTLIFLYATSLHTFLYTHTLTYSLIGVFIDLQPLHNQFNIHYIVMLIYIKCILNSILHNIYKQYI